MGRRFTPTRHVHLKLTANEALEVTGAIKELRPDDILRLLPADEGAQAPLAAQRCRKRLGQGTNKLTLYEARILLELLTALMVLPVIRSRLGVELARQGGATVGRR